MYRAEEPRLPISLQQTHREPLSTKVEGFFRLFSGAKFTA
jgi:hypothetical protein